MRHPPARAAGLLALVLVLLCAGAAPAEVNIGPLGGRGWDSGEVCQPVTAHQGATFGEHVLTNTGPDLVTVKEVTLLQPLDLTMRQAVLVPLTATVVIGTAAYWPPSPQNLQETGLEWDQREDAGGGTVPAGTSRNLVLELVPGTSAQASAAGIDVLYRAAGREYHLRTVTRIRYLTRGTCW